MVKIAHLVGCDDDCVDGRYKAGDQRGEDEDGLPVEQGWVLVEGDQVSAIPGKENGLLGRSNGSPLG